MPFSGHIDRNRVEHPRGKSMNRPVTGLEREHFKVFDDKVEQTVTHFAMEDEPLTVGLVFDTSGSMEDKLPWARIAEAAFFETANPEDEFFLVEFNNRPKLVAPMTQDCEEIQNQLTFAVPEGRTALLDAIVLAMQEMKKSTGGRHLPVIALNELPDMAAEIGIELRNRYVLGYSPTNLPRDGRYHHVQVKLVLPHGRPALKAFWRLGYYAPAQYTDAFFDRASRDQRVP